MATLCLLRLFTVSCRAWPAATRAGRALGATTSPPIDTVLSDIDGTLLTSSHALADPTRAAISRLRARGCLFVPCTGKCREGALAALGEPGLGGELRGGPGVFTNGLRVHDGETVVFERALGRDAARDAARFARESGVDLVGYAGDALVTPRRSARTDELADVYEELEEARSGMKLRPPLPAGTTSRARARSATTGSPRRRSTSCSTQ